MHYYLSDYLLDLIQNAVESRARRIEIELAEVEGWFTARIVDNGVGMDAATLARVQDPFFTDGVKHPGRRVGLGVPFLVQLCDATGGTHRLSSEAGRGTTLEFSFPAEHLDAPPMGDLAGTLEQALCFVGADEANYEMEIVRKRGKAEYRLTRSELREALGELDSVGSRELLRRYIQESEDALDE